MKKENSAGESINNFSIEHIRLGIEACPKRDDVILKELVIDKF